jgi:DNA mismatch repair ATPase MutS
MDLILNRLALNRAVPRDMVSLKKSLESVIEIFELIEKEGSERLKKIVLSK